MKYQDELTSIFEVAVFFFLQVLIIIQYDVKYVYRIAIHFRSKICSERFIIIIQPKATEFHTKSFDCEPQFEMIAASRKVQQEIAFIIKINIETFPQERIAGRAKMFHHFTATRNEFESKTLVSKFDEILRCFFLRSGVFFLLIKIMNNTNRQKIRLPILIRVIPVRLNLKCFTYGPSTFFCVYRTSPFFVKFNVLYKFC